MSMMGYDPAMAQEAIPAASAKPAGGGPAEPADLTSSTGYLLARLGAESRRRWARMLADHGLTPHHFGMLMTLDHLGVAHQRRLSELVGIDPRNAVPLLDLLQQRGLIERTGDPADRRRRAIGLTPAGHKMLKELRQTADAVEATMLKGLDGHQQATLHRLLLTLFEATIGH
jgi:MarR family transcriptional regulator, lower aerobic nicotinate degradation pathway regulator